MKHINITNWQGNITDWTKFNYIYGGLDETIADRVNLNIKGTNVRNYFRKSDNLIALENETITASGLTFTISGGKISSSGTPSGTGWIKIKSINLEVGTYSYTDFTSANSRVYLINTSYVQLTDTFTVTQASTYYIAVLGRNITNNGQLNNSSLMLVKGSTVPTTYEPYGSMVLVENVAKADMGTLGWSMSNDIFFANISDLKPASSFTTPANIYCSRYKTVSQIDLKKADKHICALNTEPQIRVYDTAYKELKAFKNSLNGLYITYELATPKVTIFNQADLGTLGWSYNAAHHVMQNTQLTNMLLPPNNNVIPNISCPIYINDTANNTYNNVKDKTISVSSTGIVQVYDSTYTNATIFKSAMKGVILIYEER